MSPVLFAFYVKSLLEKLQNSGLGCHIARLSMGAFMYADDLVLVSASISDLQSMIDVYINELNSLNMMLKNLHASVSERVTKMIVLLFLLAVFHLHGLLT